MPAFSQLSLSRLTSCHPELQALFFEVVRTFDCTILEGHRGEIAQQEAFLAGKSKLQWPNGNHNAKPSLAVDAAPYPMPSWSQVKDFIYFGGYVMGVAARLHAEGKMTYRVRYGADWNKNGRVSDESFVDAVHFELII